MEYTKIFRGRKVASAWSWKLSSSFEVKNEWSYTFISYKRSQRGA